MTFYIPTPSHSHESVPISSYSYSISTVYYIIVNNNTVIPLLVEKSSWSVTLSDPVPN